MFVCYETDKVIGVHFYHLNVVSIIKIGFSTFTFLKFYLFKCKTENRFEIQLEIATKSKHIFIKTGVRHSGSGLHLAKSQSKSIHLKMMFQILLDKDLIAFNDKIHFEGPQNLLLLNLLLY